MNNNRSRFHETWWFKYFLAPGLVLIIGGIFLHLILSKEKAPLDIQQQHVKPNISCSMEYPIKAENGKYSRDKRNPDIIVRNNGPIKAVALTVDVKIYTYNTELERIVEYTDIGLEGFGFVQSAKELEPFDHIKHSTIGVKGKNLIAAYLIDIVFHRESAPEQLSVREYFFTRNGIIYTHDDFKENEHYPKLIEKIKNYDPTDPKKRKFVVTKADEKTWFVESDSLHQARIMEDGRLRIIGDPVPQSEDPREGFPHLDIVPHRFSKCDCFIKAEIVKDHIEAKIQYRISNVGDSAAGITNNGFDIIKEIEPGMEKFNIKNMVLRRGETENRSVQDLYDRLENGNERIVMTWTILYRAENEPAKLFSVSANHEFTKNSVRSKARSKNDITPTDR